jgi:hypothetical protein
MMEIKDGTDGCDGDVTAHERQADEPTYRRLRARSTCQSASQAAWTLTTWPAM